MSKILSIVFILILAASGLIVLGNNYASAAKLSVPEFTIRYVDRSYAVAATYDVDVYTGENVTTHEAYYVQFKTIELTIKNQAFTAFKDSDNHSINLYYSVRMKGHHSDLWSYPDYSDFYVEGKPEINYIRANTDSDFTVIAYGLVGNNGTVDYYCFDIPDGGKADFQVQAFIGYYDRTTFMGILGESHQDVFTGKTSDWSSTQTVTIDGNASPASTTSPSPSSTTIDPSPSLSPSSTPSQTVSGGFILLGLDWIGVALAVLLGLVVVLLLVVVFLRRRK